MCPLWARHQTYFLAERQAPTCVVLQSDGVAEKVQVSTLTSSQWSPLHFPTQVAPRVHTSSFGALTAHRRVRFIHNIQPFTGS